MSVFHMPEQQWGTHQRPTTTKQIQFQYFPLIQIAMLSTRFFFFFFEVDVATPTSMLSYKTATTTTQFRERCCRGSRFMCYIERGWCSQITVSSKKRGLFFISWQICARTSAVVVVITDVWPRRHLQIEFKFYFQGKTSVGQKYWNPAAMERRDNFEFRWQCVDPVIESTRNKSTVPDSELCATERSVWFMVIYCCIICTWPRAFPAGHSGKLNAHPNNLTKTTSFKTFQLCTPRQMLGKAPFVNSEVSKTFQIYAQLAGKKSGSYFISLSTTEPLPVNWKVSQVEPGNCWQSECDGRGFRGLRRLVPETSVKVWPCVCVGGFADGMMRVCRTNFQNLKLSKKNIKTWRYAKLKTWE